MTAISELVGELAPGDCVMMWLNTNVFIVQFVEDGPDKGTVVIKVLFDEWAPIAGPQTAWVVGTYKTVTLRFFHEWGAARIVPELIGNYSHIHLVTGIDLRPSSDEN